MQLAFAEGGKIKGQRVALVDDEFFRRIALLEAGNDIAVDLDHMQAIKPAQQRIGQPFRYAQALRDAREDLADVETRLAAMQEDIENAAPGPEPITSDEGLTVEAVRAHRAALGVRGDPQRSPVAAASAAAGECAARDPHSLGL